jgi:hypothetical protein
MLIITNQHTQPIMLDSGVVLAAAGTDGSVRTVEGLTERDRKNEAKGLISVAPYPVPTAEAGAIQPPVAQPNSKGKGESK